MRSIITVLILVAGILSAQEKGAGTLTIETGGFKNDHGQAVLDIFQKGGLREGQDGFLHQTAPIVGGKCKFRIENLAYGDYAVRVGHDENANGKIDMGLLGIEGLGVSTNLKLTKFPLFEEISFLFSKDKPKISIQEQYLTLFDVLLSGAHSGERK